MTRRGGVGPAPDPRCPRRRVCRGWRVPPSGARVRGVSSTGTLSGADPLIAAVPARRDRGGPDRDPPRPAAAAAARPNRRAGRGFVPLLGPRRAVHGGTTAAVMIVLLAAAAIGAFSSAALVHLDRAGQASAWHTSERRSGRPPGSAPCRPTSIPRAARRPVVGRALPDADSGRVTEPPDRAARDRRGGIRRKSSGVARGSGVPAEMLSSGPGGDSVVPILISPSLAGSIRRRQGRPAIRDRHRGLPLPGPAHRDPAAFPTLPTDATYADRLAPTVRAVHPEAQLAPSSLSSMRPTTPVLHHGGRPFGHPGGDDDSRACRPGLHRFPGDGGHRRGDRDRRDPRGRLCRACRCRGAGVAGAARTIEVAHLRMLGLSRREALGLAIVEHGPNRAARLRRGVALVSACSSCSSPVWASTPSWARGSRCP